MWLYAAKDASSLWQVGATVATGVLSLTSAVLVAWFALRGTSRTADASREGQFDARVDRELDRLRQVADNAEQQEEAVRVQLGQMREAYTALRIAIRLEGYDPDDLVRRHET